MDKYRRICRVEPRVPGTIEIKESGPSGDGLNYHVTPDAREFLIIGKCDGLIVRLGNHRAIGRGPDAVSLRRLPVTPTLRAKTVYDCEQRIPFRDTNSL